MKRSKKRQRADTREGMIVTTVAFDRGQHVRLKIAAAELSTVLTAIVRQAVKEWLDRYEKGRKRK
jgi:ParG